jgi:multidrug efflux system outer membrane protein
MKRFVLLGAILLVWISGCSLAPKYDRPEAPVPPTWPQGGAYLPAGPDPLSQKAVLPEWEMFFTDPGLRQAILTALANNRDLRIASLNVERTAALYRIQRSELFPSVNAGAVMSRQRTPADLASSGKPTTQENYSVNLGIVSWEIDFFGRIRSLEDRALEQYMETEEARRSAQILLISAVAGAYLNLAADRDNLELARTTLQTQEEIYSLIYSRYRAGLATQVDVSRARTQVESARGDIIRFTRQVALDEHALNLLMGVSDPEDFPITGLSEFTAFPAVVAGLSSDILLSRPDILAAEHRLKASYANIGAARATLFPRISLTTTIGTASSDLSGLFGSGSATWSFVPQIAAPIFDARLWSAYDATWIEREIALTQYEKTIQTAFREVADALAVSGTIDQQVAAQKALVESLEDVYRLSDMRYRKGVDSYLSVLDAQRSLYAARQGLVAVELARMAGHVRLYAVLGGGKT